VLGGSHWSAVAYAAMREFAKRFALPVKILGLYDRGMTVREIQRHLAELYGTEVSPDLISRVTDAVLDEVWEWQNQPPDPVYPVVFFDALRVKMRDEAWSGVRRRSPRCIRG
jgi:transposase-like protein